MTRFGKKSKLASSSENETSDEEDHKSKPSAPPAPPKKEPEPIAVVAPAVQPTVPIVVTPAPSHVSPLEDQLNK